MKNVLQQNCLQNAKTGRGKGYGGSFIYLLFYQGDNNKIVLDMLCLHFIRLNGLHVLVYGASHG